MKTRPVFESYSEFVNSMYRSINEADEGVTFDSFIGALNNFLDDAATEAFEAFRNSATLAPELVGETDAVEAIQNQLSRVQKAIQSRISANSSLTTKMSSSSITEVKEINYDNVINGKVLINSRVGTNAFSGTSSFTDSTKFQENANVRGGYMDIYDLITLVNSANVANFYPSGSYSPSVTDEVKTGALKKGTGWDTSDEADSVVNNTGPMNQYLIIGTEGGLDFKKFTAGTPQTPISSLDTEKMKPNKVSDEKVYKSLVLYGIDNYLPTDPNNTNMIPSVYVEKELIPVQGASKEYTQPIDGGSAMFAQGKSGLQDINPENAKKIDQILTAVLSPLAGIPESITIVGGASYEGGLELNKKLVVERAEAVKNRFIKLYPQLKDKITVKKDDFSKIQTTDDPSKYEDFRKVYITVKGVLQGDTTYTEKTLLVSTKIPAGSMTIKEYVISAEFTDSSITATEGKRK